MSLDSHDLFGPAGPPHLDPVLFGMLSAVLEEESALAYEEGFADGVRTARYRPDPLLDGGPGSDLEEADDGAGPGRW